MKIGFDAKRAFNNSTGLGNYSRFVLNAIARPEQNLEITAYTPKIQAELFDNFPEEKIQYPNTQYPIPNTLWRSHGIVKDLKRDGIEIFHGLSNELPHGLRKAKIGSVVTIHDLIFKRYPHLYSKIDRWIYDQKSRHACNEADVIVAVSEQTKRDIVEFYGVDSQKVKVVYQDCHEDFFVQKTNEEKAVVLQKYNLQKPFVLTVGTLEPRKNQENLIRAFAKVFKGQNVDLVVVGKGKEYLKKLQKLVEELHISTQIRFLTHVPFADLPALYQSARVFGYVSVFEGFGIPIVEALHSGVPVLAATGSCLEEAGGGGAIYSSPTDVHEMVEKLEILWNDEVLRNQLVTSGKNHVKSFAAEKISSQLLGLYYDILKC